MRDRRRGWWAFAKRRGGDHLALVETDHFGGSVDLRRIGWNLDGKSEQEGKGIFSNAGKEIARASAGLGKLLLIKRLDLRKRKARA